MLERIETNHNGHDLGSDMDLIMTGSTSRTLIGESSYCSNDEEFDKKKREYYNHNNSNNKDGLQLNDDELIAHIVDREIEVKKITRIIDLRMMPLFCIFYFVDFLDRANIGNAT